MPTNTFFVTSGADDGGINSTDYFNNTNQYDILGVYSSDPESSDPSTFIQNHIFRRFINISIPKYAVIDSAYFEGYFQNTEGSVSTRIHAVKEVNPSAITSTSDFNSRTLTTSFVDWNMPIINNTYGNSSDIKNIIQEIVNQNDWNSGNSIQLIVKGIGSSPKSAYAWGYDCAPVYKNQLKVTWHNEPPDPPTGINVNRISDTNHTISWTNNVSTNKPYLNLKVERSEDGLNWSELANNLSGDTTSYSDTATVSNKQYLWRVRSYNNGGNSAYCTLTTYVKTSPGKEGTPRNLSAKRVGNNVVLSWISNSPYADDFLIQKAEDTTNNSDLKDVDTYVDVATVAGNMTSYVDTSPSSIKSRYIVWSRVKRSKLFNLYSSGRYSNVVNPLGAPLAPTNLSPSSLTIDITLAKTFTWQYNTTDTSDQTKYSIQFRKDGESYPATPQVNEQTGTSSSHIFAANTFMVGTYYYQIKTWGAYGTGSNWSTEASFTVSNKPTVLITNPGNNSTYGYSVLNVIWEFNDIDKDAQTQAIIELYNLSGELLETKNIFDNSLRVKFDMYLKNSSSYKVCVKVKDSTGLWSEITQTEFATNFLIPPKPVMAITYDDKTGSANINIVNPIPTQKETACIYNQLYKSIDGVNYTLFADRLPLNTTIIDYLPKLSDKTYYYVTAVSDIPTNTNSNIIELANNLTGVFFINGGMAFSKQIKVIGDVSYSEKRGKKEVLKQFEGRKYPIKYMGNEKSQIISFSCDLPYEKYNKLIEIMESENIFYRDWKGRYFNCSLSDCSFNQKDAKAYQFSAVITRIEE